MTFQVDGETRSEHAWGRPASAFSLDINRNIDHFNLVTCPSCGASEIEPRLKILGLFTPRQFKVAIGVVAAASAVLAFWQVAQ